MRQRGLREKRENFPRGCHKRDNPDLRTFPGADSIRRIAPTLLRPFLRAHP
jgi:hypothetical protein